MIIRSMRWGHDDTPIEWSRLVEICVTASDGHNYFITDSRYDTFEQIAVSPLPIYDVLAYMFEDEVDTDEELKKYQETCAEIYDFEMSEVPPEMAQSTFAEAIHLVRIAMQYYVDHDGEDDCMAAAEYLRSL